MVPCGFDESTEVIHGPSSPNYLDVESLSIARGIDEHSRPLVISCWKVTKEELDEINRTGRVWLSIYGMTMPPASVSGVKPF